MKLNFEHLLLRADQLEHLLLRADHFEHLTLRADHFEHLTLRADHFEHLTLRADQLVFVLPLLASGSSSRPSGGGSGTASRASDPKIYSE